MVWKGERASDEGADWESEGMRGECGDEVWSGMGKLEGKIAWGEGYQRFWMRGGEEGANCESGCEMLSSFTMRARV